MRTRALGALGMLLAIGACKAELGGSSASSDAAIDPIDAPVTTDDATTDDAMVPIGPWSTPTPLPNASSPNVQEDDAVIAPSGLELYFAMNEADGTKHLYVMKRATVGDAWGAPARLAINATGANDQTPRLSSDGLTLFFGSDRPGGPGNVDLYRATRATTADPFGNVQLVPAVNSAGIDKWYTPCGAERYMLVSLRGGDDDDDLFEGANGVAPSRLPISSGQIERGLGVTPDCLTMYFGSDQAGTMQLYTSTRTAIDAAWPEEVPFTDLAITGAQQEDPWISADGRTFLVTVLANGNKDVYLSTR